jgi:ParB family chromosome partitioning protein
MSKSPRKSIVASFGLLSAELESTHDAESQAPSVATPAGVNRVGAGVIGAAHRAIDDIRTERDRLRAIVEAGGGTIQELEPSLIDPSPYPDRLEDDDQTDFESFKRSMLEDGQKVPIQVRRHPAVSGRYQIVYGHRRWRAAKALGQLVRAIEVEMSDLDLVVAQGIENASRQDLSWIERALFASRMDAAGIKARDIYAALAIEDTELARMRSVYRTIPSDLIEAIGRAPKIGRPRWVEFAKAVAGNPDALGTVRETLSELRKKPIASDMRFQRVFDLLMPTSVQQKGLTLLSDRTGAKLGTLKKSSREMRIAANDQLGLKFLEFLEAELPSLIERFSRGKEDQLS